MRSGISSRRVVWVSFLVDILDVLTNLVVMLLTGSPSLREVIAFPKTTLAASPLDGSPGPISDVQLKELNLAITPPLKAAPDGEPKGDA